MTLFRFPGPVPHRALILFLACATSPLHAQQHLTLQDAIALAQQRSPQFIAARATRDAARYRDQAFSSRLLPQLTLGGTVPSYSRSIEPFYNDSGRLSYVPFQRTNATLTMSLAQKLPVTGGDLFVTSQLGRLDLSGQPRQWSSTPFTVGLRQDLFRPNTLAWDRREQSVRYVRDERTYLQSLEDVAISTTDLFFNAYAAQAGLRNAEANAAVNDTLYRLNTGRFAVGRIGENDLLQSQLALLRARSALEAARIDRDRAMEALRLGVGLPAGTTFEIEVNATVPEYEADTTRAVEMALRNSATVSDLDLQDVQARRRVNDAKLSNGVGATVQASYGFNATAPEARLAYQNLLEARQFSLSVQVPIWQWGAHSETVRAAEADRTRNDVMANSARDQLALDAKFAVLQLAQARRSLAINVVADSVAGKRYDVAFNRYVIGHITVDNLYIAQAEKDAALTQFAEGLRRYWQSHYRLRRITLFDFEANQPLH